MYTDIDEELEARAFRKIREKMPLLPEKLGEIQGVDPCLDELLPRIRRAAEKLGLRYAIVFGSLARNGCGRDVDIAVKLGRRPSSLLEIGRL